MDLDRVIANHSYASVGSSPMLDTCGRDVLVVVAKVGYRADAHGVLELDPCEVRFVDELDEGGGIRRPSDLGDEKPGTDVGLVGTAHPKPGAHARGLAWIEVAGQKHAAQLVGPRTFSARRGAAEPSTPGPLGPTPLRWDVTFGGRDDSEPTNVARLEENPIGRGFARDPTTLIGKPAPQVLPADGADGQPAGFAPIPASWQPRLARFGTMDGAWARTRAPVWPKDASPARWCWSAPGLHRETPLSPAMSIAVGGVRREGLWRFALPDYAVSFRWVIDGVEHTKRPHLDGVLVDADVGTVELSWRTSIRLPIKWQRVSAIEVHGRGEIPDAVLGTPTGFPADRPS